MWVPSAGRRRLAKERSVFTWQSTPKCHWNGDQHCERAHEHANNIVHQPPPPPLLSLSPSHPAPAAASTLGHVDADRNSNTQYPTPFSHPHTTHSHSTGTTTTTPIRAPARCVCGSVRSAVRMCRAHYIPPNDMRTWIACRCHGYACTHTHARISYGYTAYTYILCNRMCVSSTFAARA